MSVSKAWGRNVTPGGRTKVSFPTGPVVDETLIRQTRNARSTTNAMARPMITFSIAQLSPGKGFTPARPVRDNRAKEYRMVCAGHRRDVAPLPSHSLIGQ